MHSNSKSNNLRTDQMTVADAGHSWEPACLPAGFRTMDAGPESGCVATGPGTHGWGQAAQPE